MWRIMGSSPERVKITDLGDVIYYRQIKDYSDQDYEVSKDLQKAVQRGFVTVMEHSATPKSIGSPQTHLVTVNNSAPAVDMEAIKQAMREVMPLESKTQSLSDSLREIVPSIVDMIRQEISSAMSITRPVQEDRETRQLEGFIGPEYVPTVTTEGMTSNITIEAKETSGSDISNNLGLLRKLKQQSK